MSNPTGKNQYSGGRGGGKTTASRVKKGESPGAAAKRIAQHLQSSPGFSLHGGATSAVHEAFIRQGLQRQAARKKSSAKKKRR